MGSGLPGFLATGVADPDRLAEASGALVLVDALVARQKAGRVRRGDPLQLARFIWAIVHGIARLAIDGPLRCSSADVEALMRDAIHRARTGVGSAGD